MKESLGDMDAESPGQVLGKVSRGWVSVARNTGADMSFASRRFQARTTRVETFPDLCPGAW